MNHREDAIKRANSIIELHTNGGLSLEDAKKASIITVETMLGVGVYPGYQSLYQRVLNYLKS